MENVIRWPVTGASAPAAETAPEPEREPQKNELDPPITNSSTIGEVAFAVMREKIDAVRALEPIIRAEGDHEAIHDMRVAVRRLRAALSLFKDAIPQRTARLRIELRWLTRELGRVRDLDVLRDQIPGWLEASASTEREGLAVLKQLLSDRRAKVHAGLVQALDSRRYGRLLESLTAFLSRGVSPRSSAAALPAVVVVPELIAKRYRAVRKAGRKAGKSASPEQLHALRIRCKRFRYAVEFVEPLYPDPSKTILRRLAKLQDVLGEIQDGEVAIAHLRRLGEAPGRRLPNETAFAMGGVAERESRRVADLRRRFPGAFAAIQGKRWKQLRREMERSRRAGVVPIVSRA